MMTREIEPVWGSRGRNTYSFLRRSRQSVMRKP